MNSVFVSEVTVFSARLVEQRIGFVFFDSAGFVAIGAFGYEVISMCVQKLLPNSGAGFGAPSTEQILGSGNALHPGFVEPFGTYPPVPVWSPIVFRPFSIGSRLGV